MKRILAIGGLVAAAVLAPATAANAHHICVTISGDPVVCTPEDAITIDQICITSGGRPVVCV